MATLQRLLDAEPRPLADRVSAAIDIYAGELLRRSRDGRWGVRSEGGEREILLVGWEVSVPDGSQSGSFQGIGPRGAADSGRPLREYWAETEAAEADIRAEVLVKRRLETIGMMELLAAGLLAPGDPLETREGVAGRVLGDGRIEVDGVAYDGPTEAFQALGNTMANYGWGPWLVPRPDGSRPSLDDLRHVLLERQ